MSEIIRTKAPKKPEPTNHIVAEIRESFGKGAARKLRAVGKIPAVLYGHGTEPQHLTLPGHEISLLLRKTNAMIDLDINGTAQLALVKDVQKDPVRQIIEHIDLAVIRKGEKVQVDVPVHLIGEAAPGMSVDQDAHTPRTSPCQKASPLSSTPRRWYLLSARRPIKTWAKRLQLLKLPAPPKSSSKS
jgi:large subunit ribosomal protein L25